MTNLEGFMALQKGLLGQQDDNYDLPEWVYNISEGVYRMLMTYGLQSGYM